jgi:predicted phage terminase large subunit-like protein
MVVSPAKMCAEIFFNDFYAFAHRSFVELNPQTAFLPNWHIELLAERLELVRLGYIKRLIINIPPRHLKSHIASIAFPAWVLGHEPAKQILSVTYAQDLSDNLARSCRTLMLAPFYQSIFQTRLSSGREAVSDFETRHGGYRLSTSIGGVLTGRGADIIIIDDPLKADDALSETRRRSVNEWYDNTLRSRLNNQEEGAIIIVMQRLHVDDLVGHVQEHEEWNVLKLPVLSERDETYKILSIYGDAVIERKAGTILHPGQLSIRTLQTIRNAMTEYNFAAQYQQDPQPLSGNIVKRAWLTYYDKGDLPERFNLILQSWDTANKETELSDYNVCTTWGFKDKLVYLLHVFREKMEFPDLKRAVTEQARLHNAQIVLIEDKSSGTQLLQQLRSERNSIVTEAPKLDGDKVMRLRAQTAAFAAGVVRLPKQANWLADYVSELVGFPNSKYDDQVDSTVYALAWATANRTQPLYTKDSIEGLAGLGGLLRPWWMR